VLNGCLAIIARTILGTTQALCQCFWERSERIAWGRTLCSLPSLESFWAQKGFCPRRANAVTCGGAARPIQTGEPPENWKESLQKVNFQEWQIAKTKFHQSGWEAMNDHLHYPWPLALSFSGTLRDLPVMLSV
jgi:hypothetical protein